MIIYAENDIRRTPAFDKLGRIWIDGATPLEDAIKQAGVDSGHRDQALRWWAIWTLTALDSLNRNDSWASPVSDLRREELERLRPSNVIPFKRPDAEQ